MSAAAQTAGPRADASGVVHREVAGEVFLVPVRGRLADLQDFFVLNETGAFLWPLLDGTRSEADLVEALTAEFEVEPGAAAADVQDFLRRLSEAGLLEEAN